MENVDNQLLLLKLAAFGLVENVKRWHCRIHSIHSATFVGEFPDIIDEGLGLL